MQLEKETKAFKRHQRLWCGIGFYWIQLGDFKWEERNGQIYVLQNWSRIEAKTIVRKLLKLPRQSSWQFGLR